MSTTPVPGGRCPKSDRGHYFVKHSRQYGSLIQHPFWTCTNCGHEDRNPLCPCEACQAADLAQLRTTGRGQR